MAIATLGIPLPQQVMKVITEPFPCMHCGCGCTDAATCWKECCCFSTEEKLAWAKEHGVQPPAFLAALASGVEHCENETVEENCKATQCDELDVELANLKPCCRARVLAARQADKSTCCSQTSRVKTTARLPGIIAIHALKCHGHSLTVSLLPPSLPVSDLACDNLLDRNGSIALPFDSLYGSPSFDSVNPPPEFAAS